MQSIGLGANQQSANHDLGKMAYQNPDAFVIEPQASATPQNNGDMVFQLSTNTSLLVKVRGSDGVVRSATLTLA